MSKGWLLGIGFILVVLLVGCSGDEDVTIEYSEIEQAIDRGIQYLTVKQNVDGSFVGYDFNYLYGNDRILDDFVGYTIYVAWNLQNFKDDDRVAQLLGKAYSYIYGRGEVVKGYSYWRWRKSLVYDIDDTILGYMLLHKDNPEIQININTFDHIGDEYRTWFGDTQEPFDDVVNTNVLVYLAQEGFQYQDKFNTLLQKFLEGELESYYYLHFEEAFLYYLLGKEFSALPVSTHLSRRLKELVEKNNCKSVVKNVYLGTALIQTGLYETEVDKLIDVILDAQNNDGSWEEEGVFCGPYRASKGRLRAQGSKELTTSYAVKLLYTYLMMMDDKEGAGW